MLSLVRNLFGGGAAAAPAAEPEQWRAVSAPTGGFRVELPTGAVEEAQRGDAGAGEPDMYRLRTVRNGYHYSASVADYGRIGENACLNALNRERADLKGKEFKLLREEEVTVCGQRGWQVEFAYKSGSRCVRRILRAGDRLYRLDVTFDAAYAPDAIERYPRFFASLFLTAAQARQEAA